MLPLINYVVCLKKDKCFEIGEINLSKDDEGKLLELWVPNSYYVPDENNTVNKYISEVESADVYDYNDIEEILDELDEFDVEVIWVSSVKAIEERISSLKEKQIIIAPVDTLEFNKVSLNSWLDDDFISLIKKQLKTDIVDIYSFDNNSLLETFNQDELFKEVIKAHEEDDTYKVNLICELLNTDENEED